MWKQNVEMYVAYFHSHNILTIVVIALLLFRVDKAFFLNQYKNILPSNRFYMFFNFMTVMIDSND